MEPVLLGLAATSAASEAGSLLERTFETLAEPFATVLHAVAEAMSSENEEPAPIETGDLKSHLEQMQASLAGSIQQALASAGIELTEPLELRISEIDGSLEVAGEHPQKALIESALADDPDLARAFSELIALQQLLTETDEAKEENSEMVLFGEPVNSAVTAVYSTDGIAATLNFI
jgi:hypothetical protein